MVAAPGAAVAVAVAAVAAMATPAAVAVLAAVAAVTAVAVVAERGGRRAVACILLAVCPYPAPCRLPAAGADSQDSRHVNA